MEEHVTQAELIFSHLNLLTNLWQVWHRYIQRDFEEVPAEAIDALVHELRVAQTSLPEVLEPAYRGFWRIVAATIDMLALRKEGLDTREEWAVLLLRSEALIEHIQRMQRLAEEAATQS